MTHQVDSKEEIFQAIKSKCLESFHSGVTELFSMANIMMDIDGIPMHHPYHHYIVPAILLTAAARETCISAEELDEMLDEAMHRSKNIPGGFCGKCGACGAGIGAGIFMSVFTDTSPLSSESWAWANEITGICLQAISEITGPRCCKRTCYLTFRAAVPYIKEKLGFELNLSNNIQCKYYERNDECKKTKCPFFPKESDPVC